MDIGNINSALALYQYVAKAQKGNVAEKTSFADTVKQKAESSSVDRTEQYLEHLKQRFGANVYVQNVGNDQRVVDKFGASIVGYNNVAIAPNMLEKMANDPEKAAYYEQEIQKCLNDLPKHQAALSMMGHELYSYAVTVDENGVVHKILTGGLKPEVQARIEAQRKAEHAAKRERRARYQELSKEAAEKRRELAEWQYRKQTMEDIMRERAFDTAVNYHSFTGIGVARL